MELIIFLISLYLINKGLYIYQVSFITTIIIFEWIIESEDIILENSIGLKIKNSCLLINKYNINNLPLYKNLNDNFIFIINTIRKALYYKIQKIYLKNTEKSYSNLLMMYLNNFKNMHKNNTNTIFKSKELKEEINIDKQIEKYIINLKKILKK